MPSRAIFESIMEQSGGILHLAPAWVPRPFCAPGGRLGLHPADLYAEGLGRGGIGERWLSSTTGADNGAQTKQDEGQSRVVYSDGSETREVLLRDVIAELGAAVVGERIWKQQGRWPAFAKLFDYRTALPMHFHLRSEQANLVGRFGKPEAYYFPPQLNACPGEFPYSYFGLNSETARGQLRACLERLPERESGIAYLSQCYRLEPGTGWDVPAGLLHAPGTLCTYEPQGDSDVSAQVESYSKGQPIRDEWIWKDMPAARHGDVDCLLEALDWALNVDPRQHEHRFMRPVPVGDPRHSREEGFEERWICYRSVAFSAKELAVLPGHTVTIRDQAAYGMIVVQGRGSIAGHSAESVGTIRHGQLTWDEFFACEDAARRGVRFANASPCEPLVVLKHFGPGNPEMPGAGQPAVLGR